MSIRHLIMFFLIMMLVSAVGIGTEPGNLPMGVASVLGFLAAVLGLVTTSLIPLALSFLAGRRPAPASPTPARHDGFYPSDFQDVNESFWSRLMVASAKMAPLPVGKGPAPGAKAAPGRQDEAAPGGSAVSPAGDSWPQTPEPSATSSDA